MTRPLHADTHVQRAENADAASTAARERGYEASDASVPKVLGGVGAFIGLMLVGLLASGLLLHGLQQQAPPRPLVPATAPIVPPPPRLLADPLAERRRIETAARAHVAGAPIRDAMRAVAARGWGEDAPAPTVPDTARAHRDTVR